MNSQEEKNVSGDPLGIIGSIASVGGTFESGNARMLRFALQSVARELLPKEAVAKCLRRVIPKREFVEIRLSPKRKAHFANLIQCKSIWHCAVCSQRVSEVRTKEIQRAVDNAAKRGYTVALATFTLRHNARMSLAGSLGVLKEAKRFYKAGWAYKALKARFGLVGSISATEVTHGKSGWHPHHHDLLFLTSPALNPLESAISNMWLNALSHFGGDALADIGFNLTYSHQEIGNYVTKLSTQFNRSWGFAEELGKANMKRTKDRAGNTPNDLLMSVLLHDDDKAKRLWVEYALAVKGRNQLVWSKGLKALLEVGKEVTDGDILDEIYEYDVFATLTRNQWKQVLSNERYGECRADLLKAAEVGEEEFALCMIYWGLVEQD